MEQILRSRIHGVGEKARSAIRLVDTTVEQVVIRFNPPSKVVDTALCKHLRTIDRKEVVFKKEFRLAKIMYVTRIIWEVGKLLISKSTV